MLSNKQEKIKQVLAESIELESHYKDVLEGLSDSDFSDNAYTLLKSLVNELSMARSAYKITEIELSSANNSLYKNKSYKRNSYIQAEEDHLIGRPILKILYGMANEKIKYGRGELDKVFNHHLSQLSEIIKTKQELLRSKSDKLKRQIFHITKSPKSEKYINTLKGLVSELYTLLYDYDRPIPYSLKGLSSKASEQFDSEFEQLLCDNSIERNIFKYEITSRFIRENYRSIEDEESRTLDFMNNIVKSLDIVIANYSDADSRLTTQHKKKIPTPKLSRYISDLRANKLPISYTAFTHYHTEKFNAMALHVIIKNK